MIFRYQFFRQFIKFCIVGGTAAVINFSIYYSFTAQLNIWYIYSAAAGFLVSAIFNFIANKLWTFRNKETGRRILSQIFKFCITMTSGLLINIGIIYTLTEWFGLDYRVSWVFATGMVTFWNFSFNRFWTFKYRQVGQGLPLE